MQRRKGGVGEEREKVIISGAIQGKTALKSCIKGESGKVRSKIVSMSNDT